MYLDEDRELYKQLSLPRSMKQVWSIPSLIRYAEFVCQNRTFYAAEEGDDPHQLGGDFIIDRKGVVRLLHRSQTPTDRPTVNNLIATLKGL